MLPVLLLLLAAQDAPAVPHCPYDRVVELEISADDPPLIDGKGPAVAVEHEVAFEGTLHVWTKSELDLFLQVEDANEWRTLGSDDDSGGGATPYLRLEVRPGDRLLVLVAGESGTPGPVLLQLLAAPETEVTRAITEECVSVLTTVQDTAGDLDLSRQATEELYARVSGQPGTAHSELVARSMRRIDDLSFRIELPETAVRAAHWAWAHHNRVLPPDHPDLNKARIHLAVAQKRWGGLERARQLEEEALASWRRTHPESHPELLRARANLAVTLHQLGDLAGARRHYEGVLEGFEAKMGPEHGDLLMARRLLAGVMKQTGDLEGAQALEASVLEVYLQTLPEDHAELVRAEANYADTLSRLGEHEGAQALMEAAVEGFERRLPADHLDLLRVYENQATLFERAGEHPRARELFAKVHASYADHPAVGTGQLLRSRTNLAIALHGEGQLERARELFASSLEGFEAMLPSDHPVLLSARASLLIASRDLGREDEACSWAPALAEGMQERASSLLALAPRQANASLRAEDKRLSLLHALRGCLGAPILLELTETLRLVATEALRVPRTVKLDEDRRELRRQADELRRTMGDLVSASGDSEAAARRLTQLSLKRDELERALRSDLAKQGIATQSVRVPELVAALGPDEAGVGLRRLAHWERADDAQPYSMTGDHLIAHVVRPAMQPEAITLDLGPVEHLEFLVQRWRSALGVPVGKARGITRHTFAEQDVQTSGIALRQALVDPLFRALGGPPARLHLCNDDLAFLVPLDALPQDNGTPVGERTQVVQHVSFARLLNPFPPATAAPTALFVGGADFAASAPASIPPFEAGSAPPSDRSARATFQALPGTAQEISEAAALFATAFGVEAEQRTGAAATKRALAEGVSGKRFLHVATHGWFAPEGVKSILDGEAHPAGSTSALIESASGFAPMTLCGLALAGANRGPDEDGRVRGILTAEELSSLDLSACELAVLSACETNVGIRRAGQGIQSLQSALYAAGARSSITSLWKVDDAATQRLFEVFYTKLWEEELPKAQALWEAKRVLREEGAPVRDWAGWVLTGDPD